MSMQNPLHILVVDDDPGHLTTLRTIIKSWGYKVSLAENGTQAVESVKELPFDLILMDVRMAENGCSNGGNERHRGFATHQSL